LTSDDHPDSLREWRNHRRDGPACDSQAMRVPGLDRPTTGTPRTCPRTPRGLP
jgi:hypothetical protein